MITRRAGSAWLCGVLSLLPAPLAAQPAPPQAMEAVELTWNAPANCPQRELAQQRIRALAGPALRGAEPLRADARIVFVNRRYRLTLSVREKGELRERRIESSSCADLAGAAAVALGLLLRQRAVAEPGTAQPGTTQPGTTQPGTTQPGSPTSADAGASRPKPETSAGPSPNPETSKPETEPGTPPEENEGAADWNEATPPAPDAATSRRAWKFVVRAPIGTLDVGPLPKPELGLGGALGVRFDSWSVTGAGRIMSAQSWPGPASGAGAKVGRWQAETAVCRGWTLGRVDLAPCLTLGLARIWARGTGPNVSAQSRHALAAVVGAAGTGHLYVLDNLALFASAGLGFQTARPRLVIRELGEVGHVGPLQLSVSFGPEWRF